jgi:hypothetical protein
MATQSRILCGYRVNGAPRYVPVDMDPGEILCPECEGVGTVRYDAGVDGFSKPGKCTCDQCDGAGVLEIEIAEEEE